MVGSGCPRGQAALDLPVAFSAPAVQARDAPGCPIPSWSGRPDSSCFPLLPHPFSLPYPSALHLPPFYPLPLPTLLAQGPVCPRQSIQPPFDVGSARPCRVNLLSFNQGLLSHKTGGKLRGAKEPLTRPKVYSTLPACYPATPPPRRRTPQGTPHGGTETWLFPHPSLHPSPLHHPAGLAKQEGLFFIKLD